MIVRDSEPRPNGFQLSDNLWLWEIECPCCGFARVHPGAVEVYELLRRQYGPFGLNSFCRCQKHDDAQYINQPNDTAQNFTFLRLRQLDYQRDANGTVINKKTMGAFRMFSKPLPVISGYYY